jgi:hypothetical protein
MRDPGLPRRTVSIADERSTLTNDSSARRDRWRSRGRYLVWLALVPAAFAAYFWLPWPATWIETGLLVAMIVCTFVIHEMSRF